jgi:hypothetical protein
VAMAVSSRTVARFLAGRVDETEGDLFWI